MLVPIDKIPKCLRINIDKFSITQLKYLSKLLQESCQHLGGVGIHACQLGIPYDIFTINTGILDKKRPIESDFYETFFNCEYRSDIKTLTRNSNPEGCLSIPHKVYMVQRYTNIQVYGSIIRHHHATILIERYIGQPNEKLGIVFQHEIDHGQGKLISDIGYEIKPTALWA